MRSWIALVSLTLGVWGFENIDPQTFSKMARERDVVILDVRTPAEYSQGHIEGANLIPLQLFKYLYLGGKGIGEKRVLVYCRSGHRSVTAAQTLESWGVKRVYNLEGGILQWKGAGLPLKR
ncbi:MAG: rhodanese-like domain-containing protein [Epsilonproteobacteria bacterium]|nr:rhodanese-like domain-containing protein [Campylobacterota bacterium]NPA56614.1 rhodanese-like domain-containing protein [Campylobacterota bacterium]